MKTMKHFLFASLALVLLLSSVGVTPANAQGLSGKFVLPFVAHWGSATLPAGDYQFKMERLNGIVYVDNGRKIVGMILPETAGTSYATASSLVVTESGGVKSVRELRMAPAGIVLHFPAARLANHRVQISEARYLIQILPTGE